MFIGIPDPSVAAAYIMLILAVLLCTVYGWVLAYWLSRS